MFDTLASEPKICYRPPSFGKDYNDHLNYESDR